MPHGACGTKGRQKMSFTILGTGSYAPEHVVTNDDLSKLVETNDEWITQRIGVKSRHICETETNVDLAVQASQRALENAGVQPEELDLIIATTISGDTLSPGTGCMVQNRLGAHCPAFDIAAACSGFLFGLETAAGFLARGLYKRVLVVSAERMSGIVDWTDRSTCCIFGDGAGAVVLGPGDGLVASHLMTKGGDGVIKIPTHYGNSPWYKGEVPEKTSIYMNGRETYKFAVMAMSDNIKALMEHSGVSGEDVALVIPHQANYRIINEARRRIPDIAPEKFCINIDRYGNTSSASVPILLDEMNRAGKIHRGDLLVLAAFGGGLSAGAMIIRF